MKLEIKLQEVNIFMKIIYNKIDEIEVELKAAIDALINEKGGVLNA